MSGILGSTAEDTPGGEHADRWIYVQSLQVSEVRDDEKHMEHQVGSAVVDARRGSHSILVILRTDHVQASALRDVLDDTPQNERGR